MGDHRASVTAVETHVSWLFFGPEVVYKLKRPVRLDFLDFTRIHARWEACRAEVELNRRLSPDVYLGVGQVVGPHGSAEPAVVMRRLPEDRSLAELLQLRDPSVGGHLDEVASVLAAFHAGGARSSEIDADCLAPAVEAMWSENLAALDPYVPALLDPEIVGRLAELAGSFLAGRSALLAGRVAAGLAVDGHGDLQAADIFCMPDGPQIMDCLEFDERLRHLDPLADVAFLAMDLERLGRPDLADTFLAAYRERAGWGWPDSLQHYWIAHRALVRSKVACLRHDAGEPGAGAEARRLLELALAHLEAGRVRLVLVGGVPGTGKSTLAAQLGRMLGWPVLRSDVVRKELAGQPSSAHFPAPFGAGLYAAEMTASVYTELLARAGRLLAWGQSVILDASWTLRDWREGAGHVGEATSSAVIGLQCVTPPELAEARVTQRARLGRDPSDATAEIVRTLYLQADLWPEAVVIDTTEPPGQALDAALRSVLSAP